MTDQNPSGESEAETTEEAEDGEAGAPKKRFPGKKLILFIALPVVLLGLAGAGIYMSGLANPLLGIEEHEDGELLAEDTGPAVFYEIPDMLVNLNTNGRRAGYLKISISLEVGSDEDITQLESVLPRIVDNFQVYLRELRVEDLSGSAGLQRLREELLIRVSNAAAPTVIKDVLFREMLIQ